METAAPGPTSSGGGPTVEARWPAVGTQGDPPRAGRARKWGSRAKEREHTLRGKGAFGKGKSHLVRPGDRYCPECDALVFAKRAHCPDCDRDRAGPGVPPRTSGRSRSASPGRRRRSPREDESFSPPRPAPTRSDGMGIAVGGPRHQQARGKMEPGGAYSRSGRPTPPGEAAPEERAVHWAGAPESRKERR